MSDRPAIFRDLPASAFPFEIEIHGPGRKLLFREKVTGPAALDIPGWGEGGGAYTRVYFGDGQIVSLFRCPRCGMESSNLNDYERGYCGACHSYTG